MYIHIYDTYFLQIYTIFYSFYNISNISSLQCTVMYLNFNAELDVDLVTAMMDSVSSFRKGFVRLSLSLKTVLLFDKSRNALRTP